MRLALKLLIVLPFLALISSPLMSNRTKNETSSLASFEPGAIWPDNNGVHINAHGGGILYHDGVYYWYGEHKTEGEAGNRANVGVQVYSSRDLYNWTDEGIALAVTDEPGHDIEAGCILERPKVIYNARTRKFVMWFHLELKGHHYSAARSGVATSDSPTGPFRFIRSMRPNPGEWPVNVVPAHKDPESIAVAQAAEAEKPFPGDPSDRTRSHNILGAHFEGGQMARDMTLFVDDDGKAYHIYSSEHNSTLHIAELTDDYLGHTGKYVRVLEHRWMEAPAVFKYDDNYYLLASGCTGWAPNAARSAIAPTIFGPWEELGNPCVGVNPANGLGPEKTFGGQSTFVLSVHGKPNAYIAMFDMWRPENAIDGRYIWLPIYFNGDVFNIPWSDKWTIEDAFGR